MKRDMDLIRKILIQVEECDDPWGPQGDLKIDGYDDQLVSYHIKLLCEAKLLEGQSLNEMGPNGFRWWATGLTWEVVGQIR